MTRSYIAGKALLWFMVVHHVVFGVVLIVSGELAIKLAAFAFGWTVEGSPALGIAGEMMGCYLIAFAVMLLLVVGDPIRYRKLLVVALVLFVLRLLQRLVFQAKVTEVFSVPEPRYWASFVFVALIALGLLIFWRQLERDAAG